MKYNTFDRINFWYKNNLDQLVIYLIILVFVIALIPLTVNYKKAKEREIIGRFVEVEGKYFARDFEGTIELVNRFLKNHQKHDNYQKLSLFMKARSLYNLNKYDESLEIYKKLIEDYKSDEFLLVFIDGLAYSYESLKQYDKAIENFNKIISDFPDSYLVINAYKSVARCYELMDNKKEAVNVYTRMKDIFYQGQENSFIDNRISFLEGK